tara:strand:+ start:517 stop:2154 length:1638 start_codon:yes stop_codon:yes gene_type:complete
MSYFTDFSKIDKSKYYYDEVSANKVVKYIETHCYHSKGSLAGTQFVLSDWQKEKIIKPIFGWKHITPTEIKDGNGNILRTVNKRKYRKAYIEIPKKNGKSTLIGAIGQVFMDLDDEKGSEIVGLAWGIKQARIIFDMVEKSIRTSPRMRAKIDYYKSQKVLLSKDGEKRYTVWSKEAGGEDGQFPQLVIIDELHEHKNAELVSVAEKSMMGRVNPLSLTVTTAGSNLYGIGFERREYCEKVANGVLEDESQLVCIFCADKGDDIYDEKVWFKANPQLGKSISLDDFKEAVKDAKVSAHKENSFKRYFLNIWNNNVDSWINDKIWSESKWDIEESILQKHPCYGGLDLSSVSDITAFSLVWKIEDKFYSKNWFFLPQYKAANSADKNNIKYDQWVKDKHIIETDGDVVDHNFVLSKIEELSSIYQIKMIAYDKYRSHHLVPIFEEKGLMPIEFGQGWKFMAAPTPELRKEVTAKNFNHFGNPVLRWMAGNATVQLDPAGNEKVIKDKLKPHQKVDGIITNIMAFGLWLNPPKEMNTYLETDELFII